MIGVSDVVGRTLDVTAIVWRRYRRDPGVIQELHDDVLFRAWEVVWVCDPVDGMPLCLWDAIPHDTIRTQMDEFAHDLAQELLVRDDA